MNYLQTFEKLEELLINAKKIPLTSFVLLSEEKIEEIVHQLKENYPEEMKMSALIMNQKEEIVDEAKKEAYKIIDEAKKEREHLVSQQEIYQHALSKAETMKKEVKSDLIQLMREVNEVLISINKNYQHQMSRIEQQIEESYRQALEKFQEIKEQQIDTL